MTVLDQVRSAEFPGLRVEYTPGTEQTLKRMLEANSGIMLVILRVSDVLPEGMERGLKLFESAMAINRNNYVIVCIDGGVSLDAVLTRCVRPAGVLVSPFREEYMAASLRRVLKDYTALYDSEDDGEYMTVQSGKVLQRIAYRDVMYLEASDKLLNICLKRKVIRVRASLNELAQTLPADFIRCHRSYVVNRACIDHVSFSEMMITLTTQEMVPFSRKYKDALREHLYSEAEA